MQINDSFVKNLTQPPMYDNLMLLKGIVDNTPLPIAVYTGDELQIELANTAMIKAWGKGDQIIGKKYLEVLPEVQASIFPSRHSKCSGQEFPFTPKTKKWIW